MHYAVLGPRDFREEEYTNYTYVKSVLESFPDATALVSGGSRGVEELVHKFALETDIEFIKIAPVFKGRGPDAAFNIRNVEIMERCDELVVFWDGESSRVRDFIIMLMKRGKEVTLIPMK